MNPVSTNYITFFRLAEDLQRQNCGSNNLGVSWVGGQLVHILCNFCR
jgi:hypothetical protein